MLNRKKNIIFLILLVIVILILLLNMIYGFKHESKFVNIMVFLSFVVIVFQNLKIRDKHLILIIFRVILMIISLILISRFIIFHLIYWYIGPERELDRYVFPDNSSESLINVYYADMNRVSPPIELVYEKKFVLGIKCSVIVSTNLDDTTTYDLKEEYRKIQKIENRKFCKLK